MFNVGSVFANERRASERNSTLKGVFSTYPFRHHQRADFSLLTHNRFI